MKRALIAAGLFLFGFANGFALAAMVTYKFEQDAARKAFDVEKDLVAEHAKVCEQLSDCQDALRIATSSR